MKKRHEILALLAAAAGVSFTPAAQASIAQRVDASVQSSSIDAMSVTGHDYLTGRDGDIFSDEALSRMIYLASAKGFEKSGNPNAAGSPDKSAQGNGVAKGFENSGNVNAAGSPDKPAQGSGNQPS